KTVMIVSSFATRSLEEVARSHRAGPGGRTGPDGRTGARSGGQPLPYGPNDPIVPLWLQIYVYRDLGLTATLVQRAEAAGYRAFVLTVDVPRLGRRERDIRNAFRLPPTLRVANFEETHVVREYIPEPAVITWDSVSWLRSITA